MEEAEPQAAAAMAEDDNGPVKIIMTSIAKGKMNDDVEHATNVANDDARTVSFRDSYLDKIDTQALADDYNAGLRRIDIHDVVTDNTAVSTANGDTQPKQSKSSSVSFRGSLLNKIESIDREDGRDRTNIITWNEDNFDDDYDLGGNNDVTHRHSGPQHHSCRRTSDVSAITYSAITYSEIKKRRTSIWKFEIYELPQSTYTLLIAEPFISRSFLMGIVAAGLSVMSLVIVLINEIDNGTADSPYGLPAGVTPYVRMAQYLGIIIGVLMEEEVPLGLEIMGKCIEQNLMENRPFKRRKVFFSCILRMIVGYLFLACLFLTVVQEDDVLNIFFDVLALEFVEKLDDILFMLLKRGFFGKTLRLASYQKHKYQAPGDVSKSNRFHKWMKRTVKFIYFFNGFIMLLGLTILTLHQNEGDFRCRSLSVYIADHVWEESWVKVDNSGSEQEKRALNLNIHGVGEENEADDEAGVDSDSIQSQYEQRLLIYSHFNGIYQETGTFNGRPRYTEMNKEDGRPFKHTVGAELVYCTDIEAWVFRHELISTSPFREEEENECGWLLRSPETDSYDVIEVAEKGNWKIWSGQITSPEESISITCNECNNKAGCNYHGECDDQQCQCNEDHFGVHCEYDMPCKVIRSAKDENTTLHLLLDAENDDDHFVQVYGHPKYTTSGMQGIPNGLMRMGDINDDGYADDDFFEIHTQMPAFQKLMENYTFTLRYTGRRWYGQMEPPNTNSKSFNEEEYHAFWNKAFSGVGVDDNRTVIISAPSTDASPIGVDFFEMRRRNKQFEESEKNYNYGPFGVMIKLVGASGAGFFHCNKDKE